MFITTPSLVVDIAGGAGGLKKKYGLIAGLNLMGLV